MEKAKLDWIRGLPNYRTYTPKEDGDPHADFEKIETLGVSRTARIHLVKRNKETPGHPEATFALKLFDLKKLKLPDKLYKNAKGVVVRETLFSHFVDEAVALATLNHPNIIRLFEIWESKDEVACLLLQHGAKGTPIIFDQENGKFRVNPEAFPDEKSYAEQLKPMLRGIAEGLAHGRLISPRAPSDPRRPETGQRGPDQLRQTPPHRFRGLQTGQIFRGRGKSQVHRNDFLHVSGVSGAEAR